MCWSLDKIFIFRNIYLLLHMCENVMAFRQNFTMLSQKSGDKYLAVVGVVLIFQIH